MGLMLPIQRRKPIETLREAMDYVYQLEEQVRHAVSALEQGRTEKKSAGKTEITVQMVRADQMATIDSQRIAAQNAQASARSAAARAEESRQAAAAAADTAQGVASIMEEYAVNISALQDAMTALEARVEALEGNGGA